MKEHTTLEGDWGLLRKPVLFSRIPDRRDALAEVIEAALASAHVVLTSGGVSVGDHDHVKAVIEELGANLRFWGVDQKPGNPLAFWLAGDRPVFGVPGNPVVVLVCMEECVRPALRKMMGFRLLHRRALYARGACRTIATASGRSAFRLISL